ncbi:beta family protein [Kitasatospora albolonga]|uniref:beta family protein n=1 Tax=Kitasatospora albolonga TaxID=68173 RepID=UPI0031EB03E5
MKYVPILRGKAGELLALRHTSPEVRSGIRPVLEVVPDERLADAVQTFARQLAEDLPKDLVVTVDCGQLWQRGAVGTGFPGHAMAWIGEYLEQWLHRLVPAFRITEPAGALDEIREVQRTHGQGGCLRLDLGELPTSPVELTAAVHDTLDAVELAPESVDLVLDTGFLPSRQAAARLVDRALGVLEWAGAMPWRHIALAGGSFPASLAAMEPHLIATVHRHEADLWRAVVQRGCRSPVPDFGDYGIVHPQPPNHGWRGRPNLRYTVGADWYVLRAAGHAAHDALRLCRQLADSRYWDPQQGTELPWGDAQIQHRASGLTTRPGGAREWRAWGTSHHLAAVARSVAVHGVP